MSHFANGGLRHATKWTGMFQVGIAVATCLFSAGIVFGYAALKPVLIAERVYRDKCTPEELEKNVRVCSQQELDLNFIFTCAAVVTNACALPVGTLLDRYGPRFSGIIGAFFVATGCLSMAFAWRLPFDAYILGYLCLALGGPFVFISSFHLSNVFPSNRGLVLSMLTGAFDASSAVFLFYRVIYIRTDGSFGPQKFFLFYLVVPAFIFVTQLSLMPKDSYKTIEKLVQDVDDELAEEGDGQEGITNSLVIERQRIRRDSALTEVTALLGSRTIEKQQERERNKREISGVWGALHGRTAWQQICTPWWTLLTLFAIVQMVRINYFVATIRPQYQYLLGNEEQAARINDFFDIALPLGGVLAVPFIGALLDWTSTQFVVGVLVLLMTMIGVLGIMPYMWAAYANVILFVVYRPLYYTAISDYAAKVFGFQTFGTVYGLMNCISGIFNLTQAGLDALTHTVFRRDPKPVNEALLLTGAIIGAALVWYVAVQTQNLRVTKETTRAERDGTIPEETL